MLPLRTVVRAFLLAPLLAGALLGGLLGGPGGTAAVASQGLGLHGIIEGSTRTGDGLLSADVSRRTTARKTIAPVARIRLKPEPRARWVLPIDGDYRLTGRFGATSGLWSSSHTGLDFAAPLGTDIVAVTDGVVTASGYAGAYGMRTIITAADGTEYWFAHQSSVTVALGERVLAGTHIGHVGSTGNSTGPHLHLEVRAGGVPQDPAAVLASHEVHP